MSKARWCCVYRTARCRWGRSCYRTLRREESSAHCWGRLPGSRYHVRSTSYSSLPPPATVTVRPEGWSLAHKCLDRCARTWQTSFPSCPTPSPARPRRGGMANSPPSPEDAGMFPTRLTRRVAFFLTFVCALASAQAAAAQGIITGRLTVQGSNEPVAEGRVIVVGTSLFASTNSDGRYTIRNVPSGL